jgi:hypothetical protein
MEKAVRRMIEIIVAFIGTTGIIAVAYLERGRRDNKRNWESNKLDHNFVVDKIEDLGKSLGISIDRVEASAIRTEEKLDQHINDHVTGRLSSRASKKAV